MPPGSPLYGVDDASARRWVAERLGPDVAAVVDRYLPVTVATSPASQSLVVEPGPEGPQLSEVLRLRLPSPPPLEVVLQVSSPGARCARLDAIQEAPAPEAGALSVRFDQPVQVAIEVLHAGRVIGTCPLPEPSEIGVGWGPDRPAQLWAPPAGTWALVPGEDGPGLPMLLAEPCLTGALVEMLALLDGPEREQALAALATWDYRRLPGPTQVRLAEAGSRLDPEERARLGWPVVEDAPAGAATLVTEAGYTPIVYVGGRAWSAWEPVDGEDRLTLALPALGLVELVLESGGVRAGFAAVLRDGVVIAVFEDYGPRVDHDGPVCTWFSALEPPLTWGCDADTRYETGRWGPHPGCARPAYMGHLGYVRVADADGATLGSYGYLASAPGRYRFDWVDGQVRADWQPFEGSAPSSCASLP